MQRQEPSTFARIYNRFSPQQTFSLLHNGIEIGRIISAAGNLLNNKALLLLFAASGITMVKACTQVQNYKPMETSLCLTFKNLPKQFGYSFTLDLNTTALPCLQNLATSIGKGLCDLMENAPSVCAAPGGPVCSLDETTVAGNLVASLTFRNGDNRNHIYSGAVSCVIDQLNSLLSFGCPVQPATTTSSLTTSAAAISAGATSSSATTAAVTSSAATTNPPATTSGQLTNQPTPTNSSQSNSAIDLRLIILISLITISAIAIGVSLMAYVIRRHRRTNSVVAPIHVAIGRAEQPVEGSRLLDFAADRPVKAVQNPSEQVDDGVQEAAIKP